MLPSLNGRRFRSTGEVRGGDVGVDTVCEYSQEGNLIHARYSGGAIRLGFLVGTRSGDELRFRYAQLRTDGTTAAGQCTSRIELLQDGRLRLRGAWQWDSAQGSGTSIIEETR